jgi:hypothetical protein
MAIESHAGDSAQPPLTPKRAVLLGHLFVSLPVVIIMGLMPLLGNALGGEVWAVVGLVLGFVLAWMWWSCFVPLWREWAKRRGADEERTQSLAERSLLVWPRGSIFEKTEFRRRKKM